MVSRSGPVGIRRVIGPAWIASLLAHLAILGSLGTLTWTVGTSTRADDFDVHVVLKETGSDRRPVFRSGEQAQAPSPAPTDRLAPPRELSDEVLPALTEQTRSDLPEAIVTPSDALRELGGLRVSVPVPGLSGGTAVTGFFGVVSRGSRFVYVLDRSGSMGMGVNKMAIAKRELLKSLRQLTPATQFQVIFYNDRPEVLRIAGRTSLVWATPENLAATARGIQAIAPEGTTEPRAALLKALALGADVVYFLTDAQEMSGRLVAEISERNNRLHKATIHAIEIGEGAPWLEESRQLAALVRLNRGQYRYIDSQTYAMDNADDGGKGPND